MIVTFSHATDETTYVKTFYFRSTRTLRYNAGQFIELTLPHENPDARGIKRWFTLSSSPSQELLSITTKLAAVNGSTFKKALQALKAGDELTMSAALGDFVLPKQAQTPLIFVAAGMGITPFHSILEWLIATGERRPIKFIYAVRFESELIFLDTFHRAKQPLTSVISAPSAAWGGERGHIDATTILGLKKPTENTLIYLAGPESLVESLADELAATGVRSSQIVTDSFSGYSEI